MMVRSHVDAQTVENDSFRFQAHALFETGLATEQDFTAGADHALPGHAARLVQRPRDLARRAGETRGIRDVAVGRHLSFRNAAHLAQDQVEHGRFVSHFSEEC